MADPATLLPAAATETERLRLALTEAQADLQRHAAALSKLQGELGATLLEVTGAREETVQFQGLLRRAEADIAAAYARIAALTADAASREAEIARLHVVIAGLQAEVVVVAPPRRGLERGSALVRALGWLIRSVLATGPRLLAAVQRVRRRFSLVSTVASSPAPMETPLHGPIDPNARYIFRAAPLPSALSGEAEGVVTLDALYQLSRSL